MPRFQILSLTGGGYLGLYTACVLAALEDRAGEPLGRRFDLIAGTSIGGILALALAYEVPMAAVRDAFAERGREIFSDRDVPRSRLQRLRRSWKGIAAPRYSPTPLARLIEEFLGQATLGAAKHPALVPAVNLSRGETRLFRTPHHPAHAADGAVRALDAAMATAAAPLFFPLARHRGDLYMDAGVYADCPDALALHEAEHFLEQRREDVAMLSIGTMTAGFAVPPATRAEIGALAWMAKRRMIYTVLSAQQHLSRTLMAESLGERFLRIDRDNPESTWEIIDLDVAGPNAVRTLLGIGAEAAADVRARADVAPFLAHRAAPRD
ncbi:Patatin [uncultured Alphaproteobacteria bacterium]|uniref:Patatin n=1 Tax=uncultured Alphaproteobacteria bacterium TaxID=91750 RepID=A0A212JFD3_9PROT|nr:Patatin [uncultured Alphaproteobacteria bacterium]